MAVWAGGGGLFMEVNAEAAAPVDYNSVVSPRYRNCNVVISMVPAILPDPGVSSQNERTPLSNRLPYHHDPLVSLVIGQVQSGPTSSQVGRKMLRGISDTLRPPKPATITRPTTVGGAPDVINQLTHGHLGCMRSTASGLRPSTIYPIQPT